MSRPIHDPIIMEQIKSSVRYDFEFSDLTVDEIAIKHCVHRRSIYNWVKGITRKARKESRYTTIMLTNREVDLLLLAVQEYGKIAKGDWKRRTNIMEDRLATISEELQRREKLHSAPNL